MFVQKCLLAQYSEKTNTRLSSSHPKLFLVGLNRQQEANQSSHDRDGRVDGFASNYGFPQQYLNNRAEHNKM